MSSVALPPLPAAIGDKPYWSPKDLAALLGVSRRTVWAMVARRQLSRPLKISGNAVRWPAADVAAFLRRLKPTA